MRRFLLLLLVAGAAAAQTFPAGRGRWTLAANGYSGAHAHPRVALLRDGKVAVIGYPSGTIDLYDPATNRFSPGPADKPRGTPSATLLLDGRLLVAGGGGADQDCVLYDPVAGTVTPTGSLAYPRFNHTATLLPDGRVLVTGGAYIEHPGWLPAGQKSCEIYDPATGIWSPAGTLFDDRFGHTATLLPDGSVLVHGGNRGGEIHGSVELYDPRTGISTMIDSDHRGRVGHHAIVAPDGLVYFVGGSGPSSTSESYDPSTGTFSAEFYLAGENIMAAAALMPNGRILLVSDDATWLDPATGESAVTARPPVDLGSQPAAVVLQDGRLFVAGDQAAAVFDSAPAVARGDLDGDLRADVLWHHPATGRHTLWQMNGVQAASVTLERYTAGIPDFSWRMATVADPDGGGIMEAIWQGYRAPSGYLGWSAGLIVNPVHQLGVDPEWRFATAADVGGDGREDFVLRGPAGDVRIVGKVRHYSAVFFYAIVADPNFVIAAADDFDGDGTADILWRHLLRGENYIWFMDGTWAYVTSCVVARAGHTTPVTDMNYSVAGTGDFDGDGKADIVWRSVFGPTRIWFMNGVTIANDVAVPAPGAGWNVAVIGDFDADGKSDVFWRNPATGENAVTLFDGWNVKASSSLPSVTEAGWITPQY